MERNEEILFECSICKAKFKQKKGLKIHIESVHEGKKPFECCVCKEKFAQKGSIKIHIKSVHRCQNSIVM